MKKNLEGKYFGQFLVSMQEKMLKNKYMGISLNSMKTVKKIGIPNIKIQYPYNITKFSSATKTILRVSLYNNKVFHSR